MSREFNLRYERLRILELQETIENLTGKMFHEYSDELDKECVRAMDGETPRSFLINKLAKLVDELKENAK